MCRAEPAPPGRGRGPRARGSSRCSPSQATKPVPAGDLSRCGPEAPSSGRATGPSPPAAPGRSPASAQISRMIASGGPRSSKTRDLRDPGRERGDRGDRRCRPDRRSCSRAPASVASSAASPARIMKSGDWPSARIAASAASMSGAPARPALAAETRLPPPCPSRIEEAAARERGGRGPGRLERRDQPVLVRPRHAVIAGEERGQRVDRGVRPRRHRCPRTTMLAP